MAKLAYFPWKVWGNAMFGTDKSGRNSAPRAAHVIVCGNEKGGSGKSTLSMHIALALMKMGQRVATVDLDTRQQTLTRYIENRKACAVRKSIELEIPTHVVLSRVEDELTAAIQEAEAKEFSARIGLIEYDHDFIVIDTPGADTYLQRLAHMIADTLVTPINDSFIDFDVLAKVNADSYEIEGISQYAETVKSARRERRNSNGGMIDWVLVRNRLSSIQSRNELRLESCVNLLAARLGFRSAAGISERVIFKELFPAGLTALDELDETILGTKPTLSHVSARNEIRQLIDVLNLPVTQQVRNRLSERQNWLRSMFKADESSNNVLH